MKKDKINSIDNNRRSLLKTFAASGISKSLIKSSPLVAGMLFARHADAQSSGRPNKSVVLYVPGGAIHHLWAPSGSGSSMRMGSMSAGYEGVKTECNFLLNMFHSHASHGTMPLLLSTDWSRGDSYDVQMGKALGPDLPFTFLNLGVHSNGHGYITRNGNQQVSFEDSPFTAYRRVFGNLTGTPNPKTDTLDAHVEATNAIRNKLAGYEVHRLDSHLDAIADTRRRLDELSGGGFCSATPEEQDFPLNYGTFTRQARLQADIAVAALKCNLTSSVSLGFGNHQGEFSIPELSYKGNYHQAAHGVAPGETRFPNYVEMRRHLGSLSAYLIQRLREENILDETIVLETTDFGHGNTHSEHDVPFMIAGGGSAVRRGRTTQVGSSYNQYDVLHTAARACGVNLGFGREIPGVLA